MTADELWSFTDVRTADRRGDLLVLVGTAPDGAPVTITRLAPGAATDPVTHRRFHDAVEQARQRAGAGEPHIAWWDTATLSPWAATYNDPQHRGADLIGGIYDPRTAPPPPPVPEPVPTAVGRRRAAHASEPSLVQRRLPLLVGACAGVAVLVLAGGISGAVFGGDDSAGPTPAATSTTLPSAPTSRSTDDQFGTASPGTTTGQKPTLRDVEPKVVYGATWKAGDDTHTASFAGQDYAFRVPGDFDCFVAGTTSQASHLRCLRLLAEPTETRQVAVVNRDCTAKCDKAEIRLFESVLVGSDKAKWKRKDKTTRYAVEKFVNEQNGERYFRFYLSHVYPDEAGKRVKHVAAVGEAPVGSYAKQIQKTLNDVRTQSG